MKPTNKAIQASAQTAPEISSGTSRRQIIRQDRHVIHDLRCLLYIDDAAYPVINYNSFGIAISAEVTFPASFTRTNCLVKIEETELGVVDIRKVREEADPDGGYRTAFEITGQPLSVERMQVFPEIWRILDAVQSDHEKNSALPVRFIASVYELKENLQRLEKKLEELQAKQEFLSRAQIEEFESVVISATGKAIYEIWKESHKGLSEQLEKQPEEIVKHAFAFFREQMKGLLYQSPFASRTFHKPRGYAGDFEMMNLIYRHQDMGISLFGRCVEHSFLICPEPQAVRNRATYVGEHIERLLKQSSKSKVKILSVASGPAIEIQKLLWKLSGDELSRIDLYLLDQDQGSLKHAQREIRNSAKEAGKEISVTLIHKTIKEVILGGLEESGFDLIYSAGLFDYFSDSVAHTAGKSLLDRLNSGSKLVIGNFDISTPNRFTMSLVFDWNLMYRSEADLKKIFTYPGAKIQVDKEGTGINLFCVLQKT